MGVLRRYVRLLGVRHVDLNRELHGSEVELLERGMLMYREEVGRPYELAHRIEFAHGHAPLSYSSLGDHPVLEASLLDSLGPLGLVLSWRKVLPGVGREDAGVPPRGTWLYGSTVGELK